MKRLVAATLVLLACPISLLFAETVGGQLEAGAPGYGSFIVRDSESKFEIEYDHSDTVNAFNLWRSINDQSKVSFGFLAKNELIRKGTGFRMRYTLNIPMFSVGLLDISDNLVLGGGYIGAKYDFGNNRDEPEGEFYHLMFGSANQVVSRWHNGKADVKMRIGGSETGSMMHDGWGNLTEWDNYQVGVGGSLEVPMRLGILLHADTDAKRVKYNPERYFFVQEWTENYTGEAGVTIPLGNWQFLPGIGYRKLEVERDQIVDLERVEYRMQIVRKHILNLNAYGKVIYAPWHNKPGHDDLIAAGVGTSTTSVELYRRETVDQYSTFALKDEIYGLRLSWRFGSRSELEAHTGMKDYASVLDEKYSFYPHRDSIADRQSLSFSQQAEYLHNPRQVVEWSATALKWTQPTNSGFGSKTPEEVYTNRGGDCDEWACFENKMDALNRYPANTIAYWNPATSGNVGHSVGIFQDPRNHQWFLTEYGLPFKIGVSPNASLVDAARAGLLQNNKFFALHLSDTRSSFFEIRDCSNPYAYNPPLYYFPNLTVPVAGRPGIERGIDLFMGRDFLLEQ